MGNTINLLRVIRLFRLAVIINRLQRSRDAAAMRRKRAMYRRLGAPVEKVLAFLTELRSRIKSQRDQYNIDWMMEVLQLPRSAHICPHLPTSAQVSSLPTTFSRPVR